MKKNSKQMLLIILEKATAYSKQLFNCYQEYSKKKNNGFYYTRRN